MERIYSVIKKEVFESLPMKKQVGIFKIFYPNLVEDLRKEYLESKGELKVKNTKDATENFEKDLGIKVNETSNEYDFSEKGDEESSEDFIKTVKS